MSAPALAPERPFSFVASGSPFGAALDALRDAAAAVLEPAAGRRLVRSDLKGVRTADGWRLDRLSVCAQTWGGERAPFTARTFYWRDGHGPASVRELPDEPYLEGLGQVLHPAGRRAPDFEVLRYVPLRRFTWQADGLVHKVKRRSRLLDSWSRAAAVAAAARGTQVRVPALRGTTAAPVSYRQDVVAGRPLSEAATGVDLLPLMAEAGELHAALAALPVRGLPDGVPAACVPDVARAADWVGFLLPELGGLLHRARAVLLATAPAPDAAAVATCHGDLVPSHLLGAPGRWSVIDLDLAHVGDRYRDLAMFLAGLPDDVPALADGEAPEALLAAAESAYLSAYADRWGRPLDGGRLAWHRAVAELHSLSLAVCKDRLRPPAVARSCRVLERLLPELAVRR